MNSDQYDAFCRRLGESLRGSRALTVGEKQECLQRLGEVWKQNPALRLGQLLEGAVSRNKGPGNKGPDLFTIEDFPLVIAAERGEK